MSKTAGGIFKAGAGCAGCGGLGSMSTGIFAGPTALGTALAKGRRSFRGFGDLDPNDPSVMAQMNACAARGGNFDLAAGACSGADPNISACLDAGNSWDYTNNICSSTQAILNQAVQEACAKTGGSYDASTNVCTPKKGTSTTTTTKTPATYVPPVGSVAPSTGVMGFLKSSTWGIPMYAWLGVGAAMIGAYVVMKRKEEAEGGFGYGY